MFSCIFVDVNGMLYIRKEPQSPLDEGEIEVLDVNLNLFNSADEVQNLACQCGRNLMTFQPAIYYPKELIF
jgi:hypothetical protein